MVLRIKNWRELFAGALVFSFGICGILEGLRLGTGTLTHMGSGFFPVALGVLLLFLGVMIGAKQSDAEPVAIAIKPEWRGWACIILGVLSFIVLGPRAGIVPACLACVFISALGDRTATLKGAVGLAVCVTTLGVVLFYYILRMPIQLFWW